MQVLMRPARATHQLTSHRSFRSSHPTRPFLIWRTSKGLCCDGLELLEEDAEVVRLRSGCVPRPPLERGLTTCSSGAAQQDRDELGERAEEMLQLVRAVPRRRPCRPRHEQRLKRGQSRPCLAASVEVNGTQNIRMNPKT